MDAKRNKMLADTNESGYVWTGPKLIQIISPFLWHKCEKLEKLHELLKFHAE